MQKTYCLNLWKKRYISFVARSFSSVSSRKRICIVGSGPAGFYTAQQLLKNQFVEVDILEKLPVPFGLIRYGVAPDHPEIRNVTKAFTKTAYNERCNFYGNINVGEDVKISELLDSYHAVVLAHGASCDVLLGIPGEDSKNVLSARQIVGWYTGHPDFRNETVDLDTETAVIVGQGNVALDVARILLRNLDELKPTDISCFAYEALKKSRLQKVVLLGRRGPLQAAFTIKEFREMTKLSECHVKITDDIVKQLASKANELDRPKKRIIELMSEIYSGQHSSVANQRCMELKFFRNTKEIVADPEGKVEKFICSINKVKDPFDKDSKFEVTNEKDVIDCGLVIRSVGYRGSSIDSFVPFNKSKNLIPNQKGRVEDMKGVYCSGWAKTGPVGVIISTMYGSFETAEVLLDDIEKGQLPQNIQQSRENMFDILREREVKFTTFRDWEKINKLELQKGEELGKARQKFYSVEHMLQCVDSN